MLVLVLVTDGGRALTGTWLDTFEIALVTGLLTFAVNRFGLIPLAVAVFAHDTVESVPLTLNLSAWWATPTLMTLGLLLGLAAFGYYAARAGQPLFGRVLGD
jgi:hypothetical protein